jgi:uncharacterized protein (DUF1786 family)
MQRSREGAIYAQSPRHIFSTRDVRFRLIREVLTKTCTVEYLVTEPSNIPVRPTRTMLNKDNCCSLVWILFFS